MTKGRRDNGVAWGGGDTDTSSVRKAPSALSPSSEFIEDEGGMTAILEDDDGGGRIQHFPVSESTSLMLNPGKKGTPQTTGRSCDRAAAARHKERRHESGSNADPSVDINRARNLLYVSHLFAQFSEVSWQFCLVLFLAAFTDYKSVVLVSTYGFCSGLMVTLNGGKVGEFVDGKPRLYVARTLIWSQNLCVLGATGACYWLLARDATASWPASEGTKTNWEEVGAAGSGGWINKIFYGVPLDCQSLALLAAVHILGGVASVLDAGFTVAIERDWIVVMSAYAARIAFLSNSLLEQRPKTTAGKSCMSETDDDAGEGWKNAHARQQQEEARNAAQRKWLSETNIAMRQIDLSCKVVAPALAGFFVAAFNTARSVGDTAYHGNDLKGAALMVGVLNMAALLVEYVCSKNIYDLIPDLQTPSGGEEWRNSVFVDNKEIIADGESLIAPMQQEGKKSKSESLRCKLCRLPRAIRIYLSQSISLAGIALALLYLNVLTFGAIMTAYLLWKGMRIETVGVWRGISSAIGLLGTVVYRQSVHRMSLEATGMWSILYQFACMSVSSASLFVGDYDTSLSLLIGSVCASRIGLWVFDISVTQLMQQRIPEEMRGIAGGVQQSLQSFFGLLAFALGIIYPDPNDFVVLVGAGYTATGIATAVFTAGVFLQGRSTDLPNI